MLIYNLVSETPFALDTPSVLLFPWCFVSYVFIRYGLGTCYMRMSKLRLADYHFGRAADIHPNNAILLGCVGMVSQSNFQP